MILRGKMGLKIQPNVENILTHNELVPAVINPDGAIPVWPMAEGRKSTLATRLSL